MVSNVDDSRLVEELRARSVILFTKYGISEPTSIIIQPRSITNSYPKFKSENLTLYLLQAVDEKEYDNQINWAIAAYKADTHRRLSVRKASQIEWVLVVVFALDGMMVLFLPHLFELITGLVTFVSIQTICLILAWQGRIGKAKRAQLISQLMQETGSWNLEVAEGYAQGKGEFLTYIPLVGTLILVLAGWSLFFL